MVCCALRGAKGLARSGAHDTTFRLARASPANERCSSALSAGGPMVVRGAISITPRSRSASARASARSSASSASRLGAGVPSPKKCVGESEVDQPMRSEEHTSELQSLAYLVCRLLLEKKKQ